MGITIQAHIEVEDGLPATSVEIGIIDRSPQAAPSCGLGN